MSRSDRWSRARAVWSVRMLLIGSVLSATPPLVAAAGAQGVTVPVVFGSDRGNPDRRHKADVFVSSYVTKNNDAKLATGPVRLDPGLRRDALYSALEGVVSYRRKTDRMTFGAETIATIDYHPALENALGDYGGGATLRGRLRPRTELLASQRVTYFQTHRMTVIPALGESTVPVAPTPNSAEALARLEAYSSMTSVRVTQNVSKTATVDFGADFQWVDFVTGGTDLRTWTADTHLTRRVSRSSVLRLGYGHRLGLYGSAPVRQTRIHDVDVSLEQRGRRTSITVRPGASIVEGGYGGRQYRPAAELTVNHRLARAWTASMVYRRDSQFVGGFSEPFFADSATAGLTGNVGRRLELSTWAGYSAGDVGLTGQANGAAGNAPYQSYSGSARGTFLMNRHFAVTVEYLYYNHHFAADINIPAPAELDRHSLRVGMRWWNSLR